MILRIFFAFLIGLFLTISEGLAQDSIPLTMDLNSDGRVDKDDLMRMAHEWRTGSPAGNPTQYKPITGDLLKMLGEWHWQQPVITNPHTGLEEFVIPLPNLEPGAVPLVMVRIPAGTFTMGSKTLSPQLGEQWPAHEVTLTKDFYIGKYELTQAQWTAIMGNNPSLDYAANPNPFAGIGPNYPVFNVSWKDCQEYIKQLNEQGFGVFRLPSEAEWEYACRAGTTTAYSHGDASSCRLATPQCPECEISSVVNPCPEHVPYMWYNSFSSPQRIGTKLPNPWSLSDMHGNIYEWCSDFWGDNLVPAPRTDPKGPDLTPSDDLFAIIRGGSYQSKYLNVRSANRAAEGISSRISEIGFRLAASVVDVRR